MKKIMSLAAAVLLLLISAGCGGEGVPSETSSIPSSGGQTAEQQEPQTAEELYRSAVIDAMIVEEGEIQPLVSLEQGEPYALYDEDGRVLLATFHKYPDSYPEGQEVAIEWGEVWTFACGELADWYQENKEGVTDWPLRFRQLLGLPPENEATHFTAMWVDPAQVTRPANVQGIGKIEITEKLAEGTEKAYKEWFDGNIIWSYFDSAYPWTRLGYTYDWAGDGREYGLSEFLVANGSQVEVSFTATTEEMLDMLEQDGSSWMSQDRAA